MIQRLFFALLVSSWAACASQVPTLDPTAEAPVLPPAPILVQLEHHMTEASHKNGATGLFAQGTSYILIGDEGPGWFEVEVDLPSPGRYSVELIGTFTCIDGGQVWLEGQSVATESKTAFTPLTESVPAYWDIPIDCASHAPPELTFETSFLEAGDQRLRICVDYSREFFASGFRMARLRP